ncbi:MAG: PepSY domain-containing protein, partial [Mycobacteriaceae bacterium]
IVSATLMWWKRRPTGSVGLPGATSDTMRSNTPRGAVVAVGVIATGLAVIYPTFGMTLIVVLAAEAILAARRKRQTQVVG